MKNDVSGTLVVDWYNKYNAIAYFNVGIEYRHSDYTIEVCSKRQAELLTPVVIQLNTGGESVVVYSGPYVTGIQHMQSMLDSGIHRSKISFKLVNVK